MQVIDDLWGAIQEKGLNYVVIGLSRKIDKLGAKVKQLGRDNQDIRDIISRIDNGSLEDQAYIQLQKMLIDNRDVIRPQEEDIWNIHRRIDALQKQILEKQDFRT